MILLASRSGHAWGVKFRDGWLNLFLSLVCYSGHVPRLREFPNDLYIWLIRDISAGG